ncbi:hypothetical protein AMK59_1346, partial [Oryctes borbonicus]
GNNKNGYIIMRLGLVMGITWIYYIYDYINGFDSVNIFSTIGDILRYSNVLEGFYFLLIFVAKWKTMKSMLRKIGFLKKEDSVSHSDSSNTVTTSAGSTNSLNNIPMESIPNRS